jgi:hypothetical protein
MLVEKPFENWSLLKQLKWKDVIKCTLEKDGTGSGSCPMAGFGISSVTTFEFCCQECQDDFGISNIEFSGLIN